MVHALFRILHPLLQGLSGELVFFNKGGKDSPLQFLPAPDNIFSIEKDAEKAQANDNEHQPLLTLEKE